MPKLVSMTLMAVVEVAATVQGYQIISGSPKMVRLFARLRLEAAAIGFFGSLILVSVVFMFFPRRS